MIGLAADLHSALSRHLPDLRFDLREYLRSSLLIDRLNERFEWFRAAHAFAIWHGERAACGVLSALPALRTDVLAYEKYGSITSFGSIPCIDKGTLRTELATFVPKAFGDIQAHFKFTSGTTGRPVPIWFGPEFYFEFLLLTIPKIAVIAQLEEVFERSVSCIHVPDWRYRQPWIASDLCGRMGALMQMVVDDESPASIDMLFSIVDDVHPACISSKPCVLESLLHRASEWSFNPLRSVEAVISGGSNLDDDLRSELERVFQLRVIDAYGMTEFGVIASECRLRRGLHVHDPSMVVEVLDANREPLPPGQAGELTLTSLSNRALPLLRYRTGDLATIDCGRCGCGDPSPRIGQLSGRTVRAFRLASGDLVWPTHFNVLLEAFPLREFQMTQVDSRSFELVVEMRDDLELGGMREHILQFVERMLPAGHVVEVRTGTCGREAKFERYRSLL